MRHHHMQTLFLRAAKQEGRRVGSEVNQGTGERRRLYGRADLPRLIFRVFPLTEDSEEGN